MTGSKASSKVSSKMGPPKMDTKSLEMAQVITIDGPAASGKTSVSRELASRLGWEWVSTGSFYRGLAYVALQKQLDFGDRERLVQLAHSSEWAVEMTPERTLVCYLGEDVTTKINEEEVGSMASKISQYPEVRTALLQVQRDCAKGRPGLIAEGRDCGTVVFPNAPVKIYITASSSDRAARRAADQGADVSEIQAMQTQRDRQDSQRKVAPLQIPSEALVIDSSELGLQEVVQKAHDFILKKIKL